MSRRFLTFILLLGFSMIMSFCAQRSGLSGGPRDTQPPQLVRSSPSNFATGFSGERIKMEFDEFIRLDNITKNLLITPIMENDVDVIATGKKLQVRNIDDSLQANTTYVMEFNEAIEDITEGNAAKGFRFVFSTGMYLDSLQVQGVVKDAFTLKPIEDAFIFLYEEFGDSLPYIEKPRYVGRSSEDGTFVIQNMKAGQYKVFMCTDDNRNYLYDRPGDKIDFLDEAITVSSDTGQVITGHMFREDLGLQALEGYGMLNKWAFYLSFTKKVDSLHIYPQSGKAFPDVDFGRTYNTDHDSVVFWLLDTNRLEESWDIIVQPDTFPPDTIHLELYREQTAKDFTVKSNLAGKNLDLGQNLELLFEYPLIEIDTTRFYLLSDSVRIPFKWGMNPSRRMLVIESEWKENRAFELVMDSAAFTDVNGNQNDSISRKFSNRERTYYGTMEISMTGLPEGKGILMLLNKKAEEVERVLLDNKESHYFEFLNPGEYLLKYVSDENANGNWDPGNYLQGRHAEPVFIYQGSITIRSNWDQVIEWKFN